ncbi:hypothetical protein SO802_017420 [Lithocarpus litseifolius]|uniref:Uncharacterized protein n=1 Tax=Lithocarpus litseifolius TaxID=425828 RepID=A0AAW2CK85_9ROSI
MVEMMHMMQQLVVEGGQNRKFGYGQVKSQVETLAEKLRIMEGSSAHGSVDLDSLTNFPQAEGHTLEECYHLRDRLQDLIDNKLIQFDNAVAPNIITNPLPPHQEGNVNAIIIVKERILNFSSSSFPRKATL